MSNYLPHNYGLLCEINLTLDGRLLKWQQTLLQFSWSELPRERLLHSTDCSSNEMSKFFMVRARWDGYCLSSISFTWIQNSEPLGPMEMNEPMVTFPGIHSPRGGVQRKPAVLGGLKIPAQRHCAEPMPPKPLALLGYQNLFAQQNISFASGRSKHFFSIFFFFNVPNTFSSAWLWFFFFFLRTLKYFIFLPRQKKDILQWLEILLWSRMIIFHLAFWMLTKASRRINVRLQISPGYSEIAASVVGLLAQTLCETFFMHLITCFVSVVVIQGVISKSKHFS